MSSTQSKIIAHIPEKQWALETGNSEEDVTRYDEYVEGGQRRVEELETIKNQRKTLGQKGTLTQIKNPERDFNSS